MKGYFTKPGKYKNAVKVERISEDDVKSKKIYDIADKNAQEFYDVGLFAIEGKKAPEVKQEVKKEEPKKPVTVEKKK
jgi:hypothetical protein